MATNSQAQVAVKFTFYSPYTSALSVDDDYYVTLEQVDVHMQAYMMNFSVGDVEANVYVNDSNVLWLSITHNNVEVRYDVEPTVIDNKVYYSAKRLCDVFSELDTPHVNTNINDVFHQPDKEMSPFVRLHYGLPNVTSVDMHQFMSIQRSKLRNKS